MSTPVTPTPSLSDLANAAESALSTYGNDQNTVAADQSKIASMQGQLAIDQGTAAADGNAAYTAVQTLICALQAIQGTLPQPAPAPAAS